jgi:glutamyl-tRNA synthetase
MHVGNLRTALYAYLIAKHGGGDFLLRIEDTDRERLVEGATDIIYRTLAKTGLTHDEGPDVGGPVGPYVQSERREAGIYMDAAKELVARGGAYYCFCTPERLEKLKRTVEGQEIMAYDKHCLGLTDEEVAQKLAAGVPYVIRQDNPTEGRTVFHDEIYGDISVDNAELDDMVLIKSDGYPTYNFANVVDDHLMGITHVVRGNEYLSSAPKYNRLYEAFGWDVPVYVHCPLITDEEHRKLSKRSGHSSFEDLEDQGFLAGAVVNFVALLGWSPTENREIYSLAELVGAFDYRHMSKSPAVFDVQKLRWMNGEYIKAMDFEPFYVLARPYIVEGVGAAGDGVWSGVSGAGESGVGGTAGPGVSGAGEPGASCTARVDAGSAGNAAGAGTMFSEAALRRIAAMVQSRIEVFADIPGIIDFFGALPDYDIEMYTHKKMKTTAETSLAVLREVLPVLETQEDFGNDALFAALSDFAAAHGYKTGFVMWPLRTALSGKQATPGGATELMEVLGKAESLGRIRAGIGMLEGAGAGA